MKTIHKYGIEWVRHYDAEEGTAAKEVRSGTRVTIELEARYQRGRGSVDEFLQQAAIANPHVTLHYEDPEGNRHNYVCTTTTLPPEPKEIKPHPYGVELGRLITMLKDSEASTLSQFLTESFSRVSSAMSRRICKDVFNTARGKEVHGALQTKQSRKRCDWTNIAQFRGGNTSCFHTQTSSRSTTPIAHPTQNNCNQRFLFV